MLETSLSMPGTSLAMLETSLTMPGTSLTMLGPFLTMLGTSLTMLETSLSRLGSEGEGKGYLSARGRGYTVPMQVSDRSTPTAAKEDEP